jgi:prevent-host-death family protein
MSQVSIAEAKTHLPRLVQQAEAGEPVRITRRGRPVAVLLSEREFERLSAPRTGILDFLRMWRAEMDAQGIELAEGTEFDGLRDNSQRQVPAWE